MGFAAGIACAVLLQDFSWRAPEAELDAERRMGRLSRMSARVSRITNRFSVRKSTGGPSPRGAAALPSPKSPASGSGATVSRQQALHVCMSAITGHSA